MKMYDEPRGEQEHAQFVATGKSQFNRAVINGGNMWVICARTLSPEFVKHCTCVLGT
jgi:hypothetical protein